MNISKQNKLQYLLMAVLLTCSSNYNLYSAAHIEQKEDETSTSQMPQRPKELTKDELALLNFVKEGNLEGVQKMIGLGVNVNCIGRCALIDHGPKKRCIACEIIDMVWGYTPLMVAVKYGHFEIVKYLLDQKNIDVNIKCETDTARVYTALFLAAEAKDQKMLKPILDSKKLNCSSLDLYYFLFEFGSNDISNFLIKNLQYLSPLSDISQADACDFGDYVEEDCCEEFPEAMRAIKLIAMHKSIDLSSRGIDGNTALHYFYFIGASNIMKYLLGLPGLNPDVKNLDGLTIKDLAERDKNEPVLEMLEECYDTRKQITKGLFVAIKTKNIKLLRSALSQFTIACHDDNGDTTLQAAIKANDQDIINLLLNAMPGLISICNAKTGDNALHTAIICNNSELIRRLLKCRPNLVDLPNNNKLTPLDLVVLQYQLFLPLFLQATDLPKSTQSNEKSEIVKALMALGTDSIPSGSSSSSISSSTSSRSITTSSSSDVSGASDSSEAVAQPQTKRQRI